MLTTKLAAVFNVVPVPAPRMVRSDKYKRRPCVVRYFNFRNALVLQANVQKYVLSSPLIITFYVEMPASWSRQKKSLMLGTPHTSKPDLDNLIKAFMDALSASDQNIYCIHASKCWSVSNKIIVFNELK